MLAPNAAPSLAPILVAIAFAFGFATLCFTSKDTNIDERILQLHQTIVEFHGRGQLTVELFAPLSTLFFFWAPAWTRAVFDATILWPVVAILCWALIQDGNKKTGWLGFPAAFAVLIVVLWHSAGHVQENILARFNSLADACLLLTVLLAASSLERCRFLGLGELLVLIAFGCGGNQIDVQAAYCLLLIARIRDVFVKVANPRSSLTGLSLHGASSLLIGAVVWPLLFVCVIGVLLPSSEAAAGGNYNLRYLSPHARRHLSPFPAVQTRGVLPDTLYTLYTPGAGFLWSDEMIWQQRLPERLRDQANTHVNEDPDSPWYSDDSYRVYYNDKFTHRYPWMVQQVQRAISRGSKRSIRSNSTVRVYDPATQRFLCLIPGHKVVSDGIYFPDNATEEDKSIGRFRVGTVSDPSRGNCDWTIFHKSNEDNRFSLYNYQHRCHLATTFRTLADFTHNPSNDMIRPILDLKLEASCTTLASARSSQLYLVDVLNARDRSGRIMPARTMVGKIMHAVRYFRACYDLAYFRHRHAGLQALDLDVREIEGKSYARSLIEPAFLACAVYLTICAAVILARKRCWSSLQKTRSVCGLQATFVLVHVCAYYVLGARMLYTSRAAGLVSLCGLVKFGLLEFGL